MTQPGEHPYRKTKMPNARGNYIYSLIQRRFKDSIQEQCDSIDNDFLNKTIFSHSLASSSSTWRLLDEQRKLKAKKCFRIFLSLVVAQAS